MAFTPLITANELHQNLSDPNWRIIDCHFELNSSDAGQNAYKKEHIPGAIYAHLDHDLAGEVIPGKTGRHPLPKIDNLVELFSSWGIDEKVQVVVYDNRGGGIAARLWWLLKWLGHTKVALLDGGLDGWRKSGYPLISDIPQLKARVFHPNPNSEMIITVQEISTFSDSKLLLIDSRAPERYRGEVEPIDYVPGHIPGAINAYYMENLTKDQKFLSKEILASKFLSLIGRKSSQNVAFYCGSGVTATQNILAMYYAGLGMAKLYPGSWSEWITNPNRPIEKP